MLSQQAPGLVDESQSITVDAVTSDLADWLSTGDGSVGDHLVDIISNALANKVTSELDKSVGHERRKELEKSLSGHFLCSILAALACASDELEDGIPERAGETISRSRRKKHSIVDDIAINVAIRTAWSQVLQHHLLLLDPAGTRLFSRAPLLSARAQSQKNIRKSRIAALSHLVMKLLNSPPGS